MKKIYTPYIYYIAISLIVGMAGSWVQANALQNWYPFLTKPALTPPDMAFPVVWTLLYIVMGFSMGLITVKRPGYDKAIKNIFYGQLILNFLWSLCFFTFRSPWLAVVIIALLLLAIIAYIVKSWNEYRPSALLFVPYMLWVSFAAYLNLYIAMHN